MGSCPSGDPWRLCTDFPVSDLMANAELNTSLDYLFKMCIIRIYGKKVGNAFERFYFR